MNKEEIMDKQAEEFENAISKVVKETTEKCIEIYGQVNAMAISASLARTFAASMAVLTKDLPQKDEKRITNMFFETIVEEMHHLKKEMNESPKELFEIINNIIRPS